MNEILQKLLEPFPPSAISWKPGMATKDKSKCMVMAYADLRAYQERLDAVCGLDWSVQYEPWGQDRIIAKLTIGGATRCSTGEHNAQDEKNNMAGTVAEAQAFKRAAAMFGLGRYLYELPSAWVEFDAQANKISKAGQADLDKRYATWYAKTMAAQQKPAQATQKPVETIKDKKQAAVASATTEAPTDEEAAILNGWATAQDAYEWAVSVGACINVHNARESFENVVKDMGGFTKSNAGSVYLAFLRKNMVKVAA